MSSTIFCDKFGYMNNPSLNSALQMYKKISKRCIKKRIGHTIHGNSLLRRVLERIEGKKPQKTKKYVGL